jgi:hypothetical protein
MRGPIIFTLISVSLGCAAIAQDEEPPRPLTVDGIRRWQQTGALKDFSPWPLEMKLDLRLDGGSELFLAILGFSRGMDYAVFRWQGDSWKLLCDRVSCTPPLINVLDYENHDGYYDFVTFQTSGRGGFIVFVYSWNGQKYSRKADGEITYDQLYGRDSRQPPASK